MTMAADRPFVDAPVGDPHVAQQVAIAAASEFDLGEPTLMRVGMNALFRCHDVVLRVGRPSADPALGVALARRLLELGIPVVRPWSERAIVSGDLAVTAWVHVPTGQDVRVDWTTVGSVVRRVHELDVGDLPGGYPVPSPATFPWWQFDHIIDDVTAEIDDAARAGLGAAVNRNRGWAEMVDEVVCHGDVHPGNVLMTADGPLLVDWDLMCRAGPGWDHAMLITLAERWGGTAEAYGDFARGYGRSLADDPTTRALAELRNVAATLMRVRAGRADPGAKLEAERRLRYWRGDPDAPTWRAQ